MTVQAVHPDTFQGVRMEGRGKEGKAGKTQQPALAGISSKKGRKGI